MSPHPHSPHEHGPGEDPHREERQEKERWEEVEHVAEEAREEHTEFAHHVAEAVTELRQTISTADINLDIGSLDGISRGEFQDAHEAFRDGSPDQRYDELIERIDGHIDNIPDTELYLSRAEFLAREFGFSPEDGLVASADGEKLLTLMLSGAGFQGEERKTVQTILEGWREKSAVELMAAFAGRYKDKIAETPASLDSHIVTMNLIRKLRPLEHGYLWKNKAAFADFVRELITGEDFENGIDLGAFYERLERLTKENKLPTSIVAELARATLAEMSVEAREKRKHEAWEPVWGLPADTPFIAKDVARILRVGEKLVFIVTDSNGGRFVIKFETRLPREIAGDFASRHLLTFATARATLERVPDMRQLSGSEIAELKAISAGVEGVDALEKVLAPPADHGAPLLDVSLPLKMENVDVGESLMDMIAAAKKNNEPLPSALLTPENMRDLGRIAMFDLMLGNLDRFHGPTGRRKEYLNLENIDFRKSGDVYELVPLDNFSISDRLGLGLQEFKNLELKLIETLDQRTLYAQEAVHFLLSEMNLPDDPFKALMFTHGMHDTLKALRSLSLAGLHRNRYLALLLERLSQIK